MHVFPTVGINIGFRLLPTLIRLSPLPCAVYRGLRTASPITEYQQSPSPLFLYPLRTGSLTSSYHCAYSYNRTLTLFYPTDLAKVLGLDLVPTALPRVHPGRL